MYPNLSMEYICHKDFYTVWKDKNNQSHKLHHTNLSFNKNVMIFLFQ